MEIVNRKARFNYFIKDEIECGIALVGTEIKSIRLGNANINDAYARIKNNEVYLTNMLISKFEQGNIFNHDERRERKLLLNKREILKLKSGVMQDGYNIVPLKLYLKNGRAKLLIGLAKGKKLFDKREVIKQRDLEREQKKYWF